MEQHRWDIYCARLIKKVKASQAPDADYEPLAAHFSEREVAELTFAIAQMNAWNRLDVGMKLPVQALPLKAQA